MGRRREPDAVNRVVEDPQYPGCYYVRVGGTDQSYIDLADPTHLEFDYMQRMADVVDARFPRPERLRVLHIGGAGMTLARWIAATRPTSAQKVVDLDGELIDEVRRLAPLPARSGIKVRIDDGRSFLETAPPGQYDLVLLDAYTGGRVPPTLTTVEFFRLVADCLAPGGLLVANLSDGAPLSYAKRVAAGAVAVWPHTFVGADASILRGRRFGNLLLAASAGALPVSALLRLWAGGPFPYRVEDVSERRHWLGGAEPFTDADPQWSRPFDGSFLDR